MVALSEIIGSYWLILLFGTAVAHVSGNSKWQPKAHSFGTQNGSKFEGFVGKKYLLLYYGSMMTEYNNTIENNEKITHKNDISSLYIYNISIQFYVNHPIFTLMHFILTSIISQWIFINKSYDKI